MVVQASLMCGKCCGNGIVQLMRWLNSVMVAVIDVIVEMCCGGKSSNGFDRVVSLVVIFYVLAISIKDCICSLLIMQS